MVTASTSKELTASLLHANKAIDASLKMLQVAGPQKNQYVPMHQPSPEVGYRRDLPVISPVAEHPANIRYNNPGSQNPSPSTIKYGSESWGTLKDRNTIANFKTPEEGAAASFDLLGTDPKIPDPTTGKKRGYLGTKIKDAIKDWSGNTGGTPQVEAYAKKIAASIGVNPEEPITAEMLHSPKGIEFLKKMAYIEAGNMEFPMPAGGWERAQAMWEEKTKTGKFAVTSEVPAVWSPLPPTPKH